MKRFVGMALVLFAMTTQVGSSRAQDKELAESSDFRVRVQAALRLGKSGGQSARDDLEKGLKDAHPAVRVACAVALGQIGDTKSASAIESALKGESFAQVKTAMKENAEKLRGKNTVDASVGIETAKYVVQVGNMRNNSGVRPGDLDVLMQQTAKAKARSIKGAVVIDSSDKALMKRAAERKVPVLLLDGSLTKLTQTASRDGGIVITAQIDMSIRRVPAQTLKGTVSGNASASDDARATEKAITELQNRAVKGALDSAINSVGVDISALSK